MYRIICYGPRLVSYGPFETVADARTYADRYLQDFRTEVETYELPSTFDGQEGTFSDHKCSTCKPLEVGHANDQ